MGDDKGLVSREAVEKVAQGVMDRWAGASHGAAGYAVREIIEAIRALPSDAEQCEVERLRENLQYAIDTLKFYAERETWREGEFPNRRIDRDCDGDFVACPGLLARTTLRDLEVADAALKEPDQC